jgi:hypothetical protein
MRRGVQNVEVYFRVLCLFRMQSEQNQFLDFVFVAEMNSCLRLKHPYPSFIISAAMPRNAKCIAPSDQSAR